MKEFVRRIYLTTKVNDSERERKRQKKMGPSYTTILTHHFLHALISTLIFLLKLSNTFNPHSYTISLYRYTPKPRDLKAEALNPIEL